MYSNSNSPPTMCDAFPKNGAESIKINNIRLMFKSKSKYRKSVLTPESSFAYLHPKSIPNAQKG